MRGFVDKLRGRIAGSSAARELDSTPAGPEPSAAPSEALPDLAALSQELLRQYQAGNLAQAAELALRIVEIKRASVGEHHPEYASALCHHSLLLQAGGNLDAAREGLREVLKIRVESLGRIHPTVAMTLSQLGMLLVESRQWNEAEAALVESVAIRREVLDVNHPSLETDLKVLAMLSQRHDAIRATANRPSVAISAPAAPVVMPPRASVEPVVSIGTAAVVFGAPAGIRPPATADKRASSGVTEPPALISALAPASGSPSKPAETASASTGLDFHSGAAATGSAMARDISQIKSEMQALAGSLTRVGSGMIAAGQRMKTQGLPPNPQFLFEATSCHRKFASLCDEAIRRAEDLELDLSPFMSAGEDRFSLPDLTLLFDEIFRCEGDSAKQYLVRKNTLAVLARVLELTHADPRKYAALQSVHALAERLQTLVKESPKGRAPAEAHAIADGSHPLFALDRLATSNDELDDDTWTRLYETLSNSQGKRLAAAVARKRLIPRKPFATPAAPDAQAVASDTPSTTPQHVTDLMDSLLDDEDFMPARPGRHARSRRIVIPEAPALLKRPTLASAPRAKAEPVKPEPVKPPEPVKTSRVDPEPTDKTPRARPASRERDPLDFLRTQTSFISQR